MLNKEELYVQGKTPVASFRGMEGGLIGMGVWKDSGMSSKVLFCVSRGGYKGIYIAVTY